MNGRPHCSRSGVKNLPAKQKMRVLSLGQENALEKEMATHSRIPAWRIPWTEEPVSTRSSRVGHELVTNNDDYRSHTLLPSDQWALTGMSRVLTEAALLTGQLLEVLCLSQCAAKTIGKKIRLGRG